MLRLIRLPTRFRSRTTHGKCARFHPDHFQADRGVELSNVGYFLQTDTKARITVSVSKVVPVVS